MLFFRICYFFVIVQSLYISTVRKLLIYCFAIFYLLISFGMTANIHYCCGKFQHISVVGFSTHKSCCEGKPMKKGCCEDVTVCFKKSSLDQQTDKVIINLSVAVIAESSTFFAYQNENRPHVPKKISSTVHAPPPELQIPLHLKNCVFII